MTREEYYRLLKEKHEQTDWSNRASVHEYNEYARQLRSIIEWESEDE